MRDAVIEAYIINTAIVSRTAGISEAKILPISSSTFVVGVASRASAVFLSFSPAKLSAARTDAVIIGIVIKIGPRIFIEKNSMK